MVVLETERLILREWVPDDWLRFKPLATDPRVMKYISDPWPDDKIEARVRDWMALSRSRGWILWAVVHRDDAKLIGFCGFSDGFPPDVEIGWRLLPDYWGQGLATEAARAVLEMGFPRWRFPRVIAVAHTENRASIRVMEKIGMRFDEHFDYQGTPVVRFVIDNPRSQDAVHEYTDSVSIRPAQWNDAGRIAEIYNEAILSLTATFDTVPKTEEERRRWLEAHDDRHPVFVAEKEGTVVGWAALTPWSDRPAYEHTAESSFYVSQEHRGIGIGKRLKQQLIAEAQRLGFHTILARVAEGNPASVRINESFGFSHVGTMHEVGHKFGRWLDVHIMQLILNPSND